MIELKAVFSVDMGPVCFDGEFVDTSFGSLEFLTYICTLNIKICAL